MARLHWINYYDLIQLIPIWRFKWITFHSIFCITFNYLALMLFPSPSTWKMMKDAPNHVLINMICLAQTSREILKDSDIRISPVVLITPKALRTSVKTNNCSWSGSHYPPSARSLIQYVYDCIFGASVQHNNRYQTSKIQWWRIAQGTSGLTWEVGNHRWSLPYFPIFQSKCNEIAKHFYLWWIFIKTALVIRTEN